MMDEPMDERTGERTDERMDEARAREHIDRLAAELCATGPALRGLGPERRARAVAAVAARLMDPDTAPGRDARGRISRSAGLSPAMVDWALRTTLETATIEALIAMATRALTSGPGQPVPPRLVSVILAGNVFTAAWRPMILPLLVGAPVLCKGSSRDDGFPRLVAATLRQLDPEVGRALDVVSFPGGEVALEQSLFARSDVAMVYGSDATIAAVRARLPATVRLLEHGHGVSAAYVGQDALASPERATAAARAIALDAAAYDQRGCLSPHVVWIRRGGTVDGRNMARLIHEALNALDDELPRGPVPPEVGAAQMQWRGVAAVLGQLFEGAGHAVAYLDATPDQVRLGPGWRNLLVLECDGPVAAAERLAAHGAHLAAVGVACDGDERDVLAGSLPPPACPVICPVGRMQTPALDRFSAGTGEIDGLLRWMTMES